MRRKSNPVKVGNLRIGGDAPVTVQSMLSVPAHDVQGNVEQALRLERAGCEILRVAVPTREDVRLIEALKNALRIPLVADIHFDYRIALDCARAGVDKIRINPGNIGDDDHVRQVARMCQQKQIPIRIGVNSGSVEKSILQKYGAPTPEALVESALYHASLLERFDFDQIVLSMKSSGVPATFAAYRLAAERCSYPLHVGVTEAGTVHMGSLKSAAGIGALLLEGIGDTIRVSLTDDPVREVETALDLLQALELRHDRPRLISCPTCGRTKIDLMRLAQQVEERLRTVHKPITVAVMGCVVNGIGEAHEADIGIAGGDGVGALFKKGEILRKVPEDRLLDELMKEIEQLN